MPNEFNIWEPKDLHHSVIKTHKLQNLLHHKSIKNSYNELKYYACMPCIQTNLIIDDI